MAWTDQCKIEACTQVNHKVKKSGLSKKEAIRVLSVESGIPAKTLEDWYYTNLPGNPGKNKATRGSMGPEAFWGSVVRRIDKLAKDILKTGAVPADVPEDTREQLLDALTELSKPINALNNPYQH